MSFTGGRGARGRGRGSGPPQRDASSTNRDGSFRGNAQRGNAAPRGGNSRQILCGNATKASKGAFGAPTTSAFTTQQIPSGASGATQPRGEWGDRYDALTKARERERAQAIRQGLIADPDKPRALADAITPVGTCQGMCAEFERVQRYVQNDVWREELDPDITVQSSGKPAPDESRMVKKFRRAAAGLEEQLPSDLRPPSVLKRTCDYLFDEVVGLTPALEKVHHFVWDRTRAVRNDFSIQQLTKPEDLGIAIDCYERIARFHILSLHQLAVHPRPYDKYDAQQEREQLDRTLLSLMQHYDDSRGRVDLPNEAEFRAYCVIFQLQDPIPDMEDRAQSWPRHVLKDSRVQAALHLYATACNTADAQGPLKPRANHLIAQQDFQHFWTLVDSMQVSYLMACVAEIYFNLVRRTTLIALFRGFRQRANSSATNWTVDVLRDLFMFDEEDQVYTFCQAYGFSFAEREDDGQEYLNLISVKSGDLPQPNAELPKQWRSSLVEEKRFGRTIPCIINGMSVNQAQQAGLVTEGVQETEMKDVAGDVEQSMQARRGPFREESGDQTEEDNSLFIPESRKSSEQGNGAFRTPSLTNGFGSASDAQAPAVGGGSRFTFGQPSSGTFGQPSSTVNGASSEPAEEVKSVETRSQMLLGFGSVPNAAQPAGSESSSSASTLAQAVKPPTFDPSVSFSFSFKQPSKAAALTGACGDSVFAKPLPVEESSPTSESFSKPHSNGDKENEPSTRTSQYKTPFVELAPTSPEKPVGFDVQTNAAGATSPPSHVVQPEMRPFQPQLTPQSPTFPSTAHTLNATPSISVERRNSFNKTYKPGKPSPLANTSTVDDVRTGSAEELFTRLAKEVFGAGVSGFLDQYLEYAVQQAITNAQEQVRAELLRARADDFRHQVLLHRYGRQWRERLWRNRSAAKANQRRERTRRGLEEARNRGTSIINGSRASTAEPERHHKDVVDSMFQQTVRNGVRPGAPNSDQQAVPGSKRPLSSQAMNASVSRERSRKRQRSTSHVDEHGRVTKLVAADGAKADLLKRSSFLGFSLSGDALHQRSTTQTNYFRLKAMGINPSTDTTEARGTKRPRSASVEPVPDGAPKPSAAASPHGRSQWQPKAITTMPPPRGQPKETDLDEALFARLKAARESLAETTSSLKADIAKEEQLRRSLSASQSSNESPSMARARAEARWRASQKESTFGTPEPQHEGPAYRFRESKFVPREHYRRAVERAREFRDSRSRETSRPHSRFDLSIDGSLAPAVRHPSLQSQQAQQELSVQESQSQPSNTPNGSLYPSLPKWEPPQAMTESNDVSSIPQQSTWSFINADSQPSQAYPIGGFGHLGTAKKSGTISSQQAFGGPAASTYKYENFTVEPAQVEQSLSRSFGQPQAFEQPSNWAAGEQSPAASHPDIYDQTQTASEAISLLSDDGEEDEPPAYTSQFAQAPVANGSAKETDDAEVLDEAEEDEVPNSYQYTSPYPSNPYAALADQYGGDTEEDVEAEHDDDSVEGSYDDDETQTAQMPNGYHDQNGYEDGEDGDGDIEDAEKYDEEEEVYDEEGGEDGTMPVYQGHLNGDEEAFDGFDSGGDEDEETIDPGLGTWRKEPSANPALLVVGHTAEEAIELSD